MTTGVAAGLLAAASATFLARAVALRADPVLAARVDEVAGERPPTAGHRLRTVLRRIGANPTARRLARSDLLADRVARAGWRVPIEEVVGAKVLLAGLVALSALLGPMPLPVASPLATLAAFRAPDLLAARAAGRRSRLVDAALPEFLDVLAAASSAGLAGPLALRRAAATVRGPLAEELEDVIRAVDLGARWRDELGALAGRLDLPDLRRAVGAMTRSEALGSPLAEVLRDLAAEVREGRRIRATEQARKAPVKMLFPLVFLVLPAFLLLTVVPVLLATLRSIR